MSFGDLEEDIEEEEEAPEIEQPELEEVFQTDGEAAVSLERRGADRVSPPFLGKQAKARLIAARAGQLRLGAKSLLPMTQIKPNRFGKIDENEIAKQEFAAAIAGKIRFPLVVIRKFPNGTFERWVLSDFTAIARD